MKLFQTNKLLHQQLK